jgi:phosphoglucomutase
VLASIAKESIDVSVLAGEKVLTVFTSAPGDGNAIGGVKVVAENGWFAARPSGTEAIYKIYVESFRDEVHLKQIQAEAQNIVSNIFTTVAPAAS